MAPELVEFDREDAYLAGLRQEKTEAVSHAVEQRTIILPKGGELHVDMTQEFIDRIRLTFNLGESVSPTNDQIRMYIFGSVNCAINKEESK